MNFAIDYNDLGIVYYGSHEFDKAISMFNKAAGLVLKAEQEQESEIKDLEENHREAVQLHEASETCICHCNSGNLTSGTFQESGSYASSSNINTDTPYSIFTYLRPFPLQTLTLEVESSTALLFNLGLAHHIKYLHSRDSECRQKSMRLYDLATQVSTLQEVDSSLVGHIQICILNNMATLFHQMGQYQYSSTVLREMDSLMIVHCKTCKDFDKDAWELFIMNSEFLVEPSTALAA